VSLADAAQLRAVLPPDLSGRAEELAERLRRRLRPTPLEWHEELGCFLKREDLDAATTHKSRGIGLQLALADLDGARGVVFSSSGNAAVAAGSWCDALGLPCLAFLSDKTELSKVQAVALTGATTAVTPKPKNFSRYAARYGGLVDLRPSLDPHGSIGYRTLAPELTAQLSSPPTSIFLFVNSGLTLLGIWDGYQRLLEQGLVAFVPRLHAVQCTSSPALAEALHVEPELESRPVAGALGAQEPAHLPETATAIARSGGRLWMVTNDEVLDERQQLARHRIGMAIESAAMMAGLRKARRRLDLNIVFRRQV
jgi:threonine synthase